MSKRKKICIKSSGDNRFGRMNGKGLPTLQMGDGSISVTTTKIGHKDSPGCATGIIFGLNPEGKDYEVGSRFDTDFIEDEHLFQIVSSNPDSLQVVIDQLMRAKASLMADQMRNVDFGWEVVVVRHDSDCATHNKGVPEMLGPCDCSVSKESNDDKER